MPDSAGSVYPRPDFERVSLHWKCLNGPWDFLFDDEDVGLQSGWYRTALPSSVVVENTPDTKTTPASESENITAKIAANTQNLIQGNLSLRNRNAATHEKRKINVPFVFQSEASGIGERDVHEVMWYERRIEDIRTDEAKSNGSRLLLRFGAVDYECKVWANGEYVGGHRGGHVPFDIDITAAIEGSNAESHRLTLRVYDSAYDLTQPRGKQYWGAKPESIFYTPSGGIWQNVWLESVPSTRLADSSHGTILRNNDIESGTLRTTIAVLGKRSGHKYSVEIEATYMDISVGISERMVLPRHADSVNLDLDLRLSDDEKLEDVLTNNPRAWLKGLALWSPEFPQLYNVAIRLFDSTDTIIDQVKTFTGMRSLDWTSGDGTFKLNGYPIFQVLNLDQGYWPKTFMTPPSPDALKTDIEIAKLMGFNGCRKHQKVEDPLFLYYADRMGYLVWGEMANAYSFSDAYVERFNQEWMEAVRRDINHPCIVTWTPVNESWAYPDLNKNSEQRNHVRSLYYLTK
jgi:beta-galactosidase/beta-glucuronidase